MSQEGLRIYHMGGILGSAGSARVGRVGKLRRKLDGRSGNGSGLRERPLLHVFLQVGECLADTVEFDVRALGGAKSVGEGGAIFDGKDVAAEREEVGRGGNGHMAIIADPRGSGVCRECGSAGGGVDSGADGLKRRGESAEGGV